MSEGQTEREALLVARVKELEAAAALHATKDASAGTVEQVWRYLTAYVPPWIIAAGLAVFLSFHGWEYYNKAQMAVAETQLTKAQASLKDVEANARNTRIEGQPLQTAAVKAELEKKQQEAARAKIEANAQNAMIDDVTVRLQTLKAELANKRAQAAKARAAADAASARFGLQTLEQRAVRAKLIVQQLTTVETRTQAAAAASVNTGAGVYQAMLQAECENNAYAELIGCPARYVRRAAVEQPRAVVRQATAQPPGAEGLRKPTLWDCAKASMGADYVICASASLLDAEARLEDAYKAARAARGDAVKTEQIAWNKGYGPACGLPLRGRPAPEQISQARGCIGAAIDKRIRELRAQ